MDDLGSDVNTFFVDNHTLESGVVLTDVPVAYSTWGRLNAAGDNVVVVCHALTGDTDVGSWWGPMLGPGRVLDTDRYFVVCANVIGSPYGTVGPLSVDPETDRPYGPDFPEVTIRDTVRLHRRLVEELGATRIRFVTGGSMGGMQVLEWAFHDDLVEAIAPIAVGARHSAWCIGWSEMQRQAIFADPLWSDGWYDPDHPPAQGLSAARMAAIISYRTRTSFEERFGRDRMPEDGLFATQSYLRYQGRKLVNRFDANCYVQLTYQMDTHDLARDRGEMADVLASINLPALVVGIDSDGLYPLEEQVQLAENLPNGELAVVTSIHGHDAFLIEFDILERIFRTWIETTIDSDVSRALHESESVS